MFLLHPTIFIWDFLILFSICLLLAVAIGTTVQLRRQKYKTAAKLGLELTGGLSVIVIIIICYSAFIEPKTLMITEHSIQLDPVNPLKIAVLADTQVGFYKDSRFLEHVVTETNRMLPDFIFIAGDLIQDDYSDINELHPLRNLRASAGIYAVLGNHDQGRGRSDEVADYLEALNIRVLRNEHDVVSLGTEKIVIAGINDLTTGFGNASTALAGAPSNLITILLSHNPSVIAQPAAAKADLIISGHTHGGQIRLPWLGPIRRLPISIDQKYDQGVFELADDNYLAITRGLGETWMRLRLLAWPEVMILNIK